MDVSKDSALKIAEFLLQIKAVRLSPREPFQWSSGWKSPIYCDNRKTLSYPNIRTFIRQQLTEVVTEEFGKPDAIVGVATGGIPQGVLVAQELGTSFAYIRPKPKEHGMQNRIEGVLTDEQNVVVIEDLISTGKSSIAAVEALRENDITVKGLVSIFTYNLPAAEENLKNANLQAYSLCDYETLIEQALRSEYIAEKDLEPLRKWRESPETWGK